MSDEEPARAADAEHASFRLAQGLKACRSVVANYRMMLGGEANDNRPASSVEDEFFLFDKPSAPDEV